MATVSVELFDYGDSPGSDRRFHTLLRLGRSGRRTVVLALWDHQRTRDSESADCAYADYEYTILHGSPVHDRFHFDYTGRRFYVAAAVVGPRRIDGGFQAVRMCWTDVGMMLFELPARGLGLEVLFPKGEDELSGGPRIPVPSSTGCRLSSRTCRNCIWACTSRGICGGLRRRRFPRRLRRSRLHSHARCRLRSWDYCARLRALRDWLPVLKSRRPSCQRPQTTMV